MHYLDAIPELINKVAGILELLIVRLTLLFLLVLGAYTMLKAHRRADRSFRDAGEASEHTKENQQRGDSG